MYVAQFKKWDHPSYYPVRALTTALVEVSFVPRSTSLTIGRVLNKTRLRTKMFRRNRIFVPLMGPRGEHLAAAWVHGEPSVYAWDIWQSNADLWVSILSRYDVRVLIASSSQGAALLKSRGYAGEVFYLPEATNINDYDGTKRLADRGIHILELGRRNSKWHELIVSSRPNFDKHLFEKNVGQVVFPSHSDLIRGLGDSIISVCFPRALPSPGDREVETFTHRYLESMASGCIVLGHAPADLIDLFGYNPVVEVDWAAPVEQLHEILERYDSYIPLITKNLERLREVGHWGHRAMRIREIVNISP